MHRTVWLTVVVIVLLTVTVAAEAASSAAIRSTSEQVREHAQPKSPSQQIRQHFQAIMAVLEDRTLSGADRAAAIRARVAHTFDFTAMASRAVGTNGTAAQRRSFTQRFDQFLGDVYVAIVDRPARRVRTVLSRLHYGKESVNGDQANVQLTFDSGTGPIPIDVDLVRHGSEWRIYDLAANGIRLTDSYRAQIDRILENGSFQDLLERIDARRGDLTTPVAREPRRPARTVIARRSAPPPAAPVVSAP